MRTILGLALISSARFCEAVATDAAPGPTGEATPAATKALVEKVKMEDGREVEFTGKRKLLKDYIKPEDGSPPIIILDFRNGATRRFQIPPELLFDFAGHGGLQKLGDETAGIDDIDDQVLAVDELIERLSKRNEDGSFAGEWNTKREGGGMGGTSVLIKALVELSKKAEETVEQATIRVKGFLKDKSQADKMALRNSAKVKPVIDRLESEKLAKAAKVDTDALLAQLG